MKDFLDTASQNIMKFGTNLPKAAQSRLQLKVGSINRQGFELGVDQVLYELLQSLLLCAGRGF